MRMPRKVTLEIRQIVHLPRVTVEFHQIVSALATKSYKLNCYASELVLDWTSAWQNCDCAISFVYPEVSQLNFIRWKCDMCNIDIRIYIYTNIIISLWFLRIQKVDAERPKVHEAHRLQGSILILQKLKAKLERETRQSVRES